jgi:hypothetical protein
VTIHINNVTSRCAWAFLVGIPGCYTRNLDVNAEGNSPQLRLIQVWNFTPIPVFINI